MRGAEAAECRPVCNCAPCVCLCSFIEAVNADVTQSEIHFSSNRCVQLAAKPSQSQNWDIEGQGSKDTDAGSLRTIPCLDAL